MEKQCKKAHIVYFIKESIIKLIKVVKKDKVHRS